MWWDSARALLALHAAHAHCMAVTLVMSIGADWGRVSRLVAE